MSKEQTETDNGRKQSLEMYYDLRYKYSKMKQQQQSISFNFQHEIREIQKLLTNKYKINDTIDLNKIRKKAADDAYNDSIIIDKMELQTYFECLIYGYIRSHLESVYIPDDIKHMCYVFYDIYLIHNENCNVNVYSDSQLTKLLIETDSICDHDNDTSYSILTGTPMRTIGNKWQIKLKIINEKTVNYQFGIVSQFSYSNSKEIKNFRFDDKNIQNAIYWDNGINIMENGMILKDTTVDWDVWHDNIGICFENNKLSISDSTDKYTTYMPVFNDDGTVIDYYFAMVLKKGMKYEMLMSGEGRHWNYDSDSDFYDSDDEEHARRLQEFEWKIAHRPSPKELVEKSILYKSVENMAPSLQNTSKYLEETVFRNRISKQELILKGYLDANIE
eukprot:537260_1